MDRKGAMSVSLKLMMFALAIVIFFSLLTLVQKDLVYNILAPAHNLLQQGEQTVDDIEPVQPSNGGSGSGSGGSGSGGSGSGTAGNPPPDHIAASEIGGGQPYVQRLQQEGGETFCEAPSGATTVSSYSELKNALESAGDGDIVYVEAGAEIDMTNEDTIEAGSGVTLAGNRGCNGAPGPLLFSDDNEGNYQIEMGDGSRFIGLRLQGPFEEYFNPRDEGCREGGDVDWYCQDTDGLTIDNGEVANSEITGWTYAISAGGDTHVHHNYIHHNPYESLGYGVSTGDSPLIEFNYFNYNRHSIASSHTTSYEARYNIVGPEWVGHQFDVHGAGRDGHLGGQAGVEVRIHHNTFMATHDLEAKTRNPGGEQEAVVIRGRPETCAWVHNNWFYHDSQEGAVLQHGGEGNMYVQDNHYGEQEPSDCNLGAPREGCTVQPAQQPTSCS